ncbi:MAG TPA: gliding motility protein GldL [Bacteroidales bacterium]|nr:gliding motility protein GldL [Bacteroidales bacterium]
MNVMTALVQSKGFKKAIDKLYGFGASVVVMGALFKLEHWAGADYMLTAGLVTEAVIFFFSAFNTEEEPESVNAEVLENPSMEVEGYTTFSPRNQSIESGEGLTALAKFNRMLDEAEITPSMLQDLGAGMRKLGETAENMNSLGNVSGASKQYLKTIESADKSLAKLAKTYEKSISKITLNTVIKYSSISNSLTMIEDEAKMYQHYMKSLNRNIFELSEVYALQKRDAVEYLNDMADSASDAKRYREEIKKLNDNLSALNNVYGSMLNAMNVKGS